MPLYMQIDTAVSGSDAGTVYDAGCRNVQFDDCTWGMIADSVGHVLYGTTPEGVKEVQRIHKDLNNAVIRRLPADMTVHPCLPR